MECFPEETGPISQSRRRRVSFADEVTMMSVEDSPEFSQLVPPLILPVVVEEAVLVFGSRSDTADPAGGGGAQ